MRPTFIVHPPFFAAGAVTHSYSGFSIVINFHALTISRSVLRALLLDGGIKEAEAVAGIHSDPVYMFPLPIHRSPYTDSIAPRSCRLIKRMAAAAAVLAATTVFTADFPVKPVRIMTPFPPGGSVDLVARLLSAEVARRFQGKRDESGVVSA